MDDAHSLGVLGPQGRGTAAHFGLTDDVAMIMGTFSKALGGFGAYLAGSKKLITYLINTCRSFIYSTALPPAVIAGNLAGIDLIKEEPYRRKQLLNSAQYLRGALREEGFQVEGDSQIIPLIIGDNLKAREFAERLQQRGYWVLPIRPPTVPAGTARLRFSLTFYHTKEILQRLFDDIRDVKI